MIHRGKGSFTHVENTVFFDRELSLKAKGIYCQIRSLEGNPEWVFTIRGFAALVKDGVDSVSAGIKELESAGYVIRARRRGEAGRFLKAEEATWITLDDPAIHDAVAEELRAEGFAILSEFVRKDRAPKARDAEEEGRGTEKAQVVPRTGKPVSGPATSGKATSGKPRSGEPGAINYSWDKTPESNQLPLSSSPREAEGEGEGGGFEPYRRGEFPEEFERLCAMSIKPVASLRFKRSCLAAWEKRVAEGYLPGQIADAYAAYAESYRGRNGGDGRLAKNLARWLEGGGTPARVVGRTHPPGRPGMRRGAPRHGGARQGGPGVREALAQGRLAPQRDPVAALRPQSRGVEGGVRGGMRGGRGAREAHGGMRGALRALPRPVRLDGGRRCRGKEGRVVRIAMRFARWLFRAVFRFM